MRSTNTLKDSKHVLAGDVTLADFDQNLHGHLWKEI